MTMKHRGAHLTEKRERALGAAGGEVGLFRWRDERHRVASEGGAAEPHYEATTARPLARRRGALRDISVPRPSKRTARRSYVREARPPLSSLADRLRETQSPRPTRSSLAETKRDDLSPRDALSSTHLSLPGVSGDGTGRAGTERESSPPLKACDRRLRIRNGPLRAPYVSPP